MPLSRFAFIVKARGYSPAEHRTTLESPFFSTLVVGVPDVGLAIDVSAQLVSEGIQLIELCGGFSKADAEAISKHIGNAIPIGVVSYTSEEQAELARIFGDSSEPG